MVLDHLLLTNEFGPYVTSLPSLCFMSLSYCVGLVYRHTVLVVRGVELSNDVETDALVKLSVKR